MENIFLDCNAQEKQRRSHAAHQNIDLSVELSAEAEPLVTVAGCVNVVSGHLFLIDKDILGNTIDPLLFIRYYDSGSKAQSMLGYGYGSQFSLWASDLFRGSRHHYAALSEREGSWAYYQTKHGNAVFSIDPRVLEKGYTNLNRHKKSNFVNRRAKFIENPNNDEAY